jgi:hypothetical protein
MADYRNGRSFKVRVQISPGEFFERVTWSDCGSTEDAWAQTLERLTALNLRTGFTPRMESVEQVASPDPAELPPLNPDEIRLNLGRLGRFQSELLKLILDMDLRPNAGSSRVEFAIKADDLKRALEAFDQLILPPLKKGIS